MLSRTYNFIKRGNFQAYRYASQLYYESYGDPLEVIQIKDQSTTESSLKSTQVKIRFQASPINPADINQIQGVYPVKPALPAVGGNEGFG